MKNKYSDIPDSVKRYCELRGISVAKFCEIQYKWSEFFDKIRKAYSVGELVIK